ncbi:MAG: hypothetical protein ABII08_02525 [Candidatus Beckwithbacteria bacterium]
MAEKGSWKNWYDLLSEAIDKRQEEFQKSFGSIDDRVDKLIKKFEQNPPPMEKLVKDVFQEMGENGLFILLYRLAGNDRDDSEWRGGGKIKFEVDLGEIGLSQIDQKYVFCPMPEEQHIPYMPPENGMYLSRYYDALVETLDEGKVQFGKLSGRMSSPNYEGRGLSLEVDNLKEPWQKEGSVFKVGELKRIVKIELGYAQAGLDVEDAFRLRLVGAGNLSNWKGSLSNCRVGPEEIGDLTKIARVAEDLAGVGFLGNHAPGA